jgi:long-chain acyl-CoA synthetase
VEYAVAQQLVLSKIRPAVGLDRLICCMSGSAPLHRDIAYTYAGLGIVICEGYGLTETSPVATTNRLADNRIGTVGKAIPHVEVRIAEDGEVLVRGPNVMKGYYHRREQPIDADGWFSTGDIGMLDGDGYLRITDRKKELFKTSGGKYIAPSRVEMALRRSPYIAQALVTGLGQPYPVALIGPNWDLLGKELGISGGDPAVLAERPDVHEFFKGQVRSQTADLASFEQIRYFAVLPRELTVEAGDLSPALKMKRRIIEERFADYVKQAYESATRD